MVNSNSSRGAGGRLLRATAVAFVLLTVLSAPAVAGAEAATTVRVDAATERVAVSETTTVHLVVDGVDGGVGAYDLGIALSDPSVATISDVRLVGEPRLNTVEVAEDGSSADLKAALMDTDDTGRVAIAAVTLSGVAPGTTDVSVSVSALGAEDGSRYPTEVDAASVTVDAVGAVASNDYQSTAGSDSVDEPSEPDESADGSDESVDDSDDSVDASGDSAVGDAPADGSDAGSVDDASETPDDSDASALDAPTDADRQASTDGAFSFAPAGASIWLVALVALAAAALVATLFAVRRR
ncbi:hypothetical protein [Halogeometricum luteum]|uniref:Cohesin domain-containing protein n=1 Tax=Halogeometricum luteum TaxID=2950537 RepID=A0ABU2G499_9EURY|nr:hypothetical protein [Halogeometricum sp. S3BR5-2]MDS0295605.1 hypothetical protein [Halogeometricum sp. S3BR5-2]